MDPAAAERLTAHFREGFREDPERTFREWFRLQEELRGTGDAELSRALADDLWDRLPEIPFETREGRARFCHNLGVLLGTAGPAGNLPRARECFGFALSVWTAESDPGARSRALHNHANALANLGDSPDHLREALSLYEQALQWRDSEREIARGVTRHNMGLAWRRLAALRPEERREALERSAEALREALEIRARHELAEGYALSAFQLGLTLRELGAEEAQELLLQASEEFDRLGMPAKAALAREAAGGAEAQEGGPGGVPASS